MRHRINLSDMLIFRMLGGLCNLIMVNLLFIACSLPIITIGASAAGLFRVTIMMTRHQDPSVVKEFFGAFTKYFKESTLTWLLGLFGGAFFGLDLYVIFTKIDKKYLLLQIPVWIFIFVILSILIYSFPLISTYPDKVRSTWKNAILLSLSNVPVTIFVVAMHLLVLWIAGKNGEYLIGVFSIMIFCGFGLLGYISSFFINRIFLKITGEDPSDTEAGKIDYNDADQVDEQEDVDDTVIETSDDN